jgi:cation:H+ antiporter
MILKKMVWVQAVIFILSLVFLIKGSDYFVKSSAALARRLGVSELVIGLTLVAVGTSIPELGTSIAGAFHKVSGLVIGNIVGSNIANICLIIGIAATVAAIKTKKEMLRRDGYIMLFAAVLFFIFVLDQELSRIEGIIFILLYVAYIFFLMEMKPGYTTSYQFSGFITYFFKFGYFGTIKKIIISWLRNNKLHNGRSRKSFFEKGLKRDIMIIIGSIAAITLGAEFLVRETLFFADLLNVTDTIIGTTVVAVGTSLPELMVSMIAAKKGYGDIAIGNILGSNIVNIFLLLGIASVIYPLSVLKLTLAYSIPFMIISSVVFILFIKTGWCIRRGKGIFLLHMYILFLVFLYILSSRIV